MPAQISPTLSPGSSLSTRPARARPGLGGRRGARGAAEAEGSGPDTPRSQHRHTDAGAPGFPPSLLVSICLKILSVRFSGVDSSSGIFITEDTIL